MPPSSISRPGERASELDRLLSSVQPLVDAHVREADIRWSTASGNLALNLQELEPTCKKTLVEPHSPEDLKSLLGLSIPTWASQGKGLYDSVHDILRYSVDTWDHGFLDKLYSSTDAPGVVAELVLAVLNTNVHVYTVSPALTIVEKYTAEQLAHMFGLRGLNAGGVTMPGGAASNMTSMLIARNNMFPQAKTEGLASIGAPLVVFTSEASHYSISMAAGQLGLGSNNVKAIRTTSDGSMDASALRAAVEAIEQAGCIPFYVCATSGTTVTGAYDRLSAISEVCKEYGLWMHVDGCWGGSAIFSSMHRDSLAGSECADSIAFNPHKMLGVPLTCAFLLGADMRKFYYANNLEAGYLFHTTDATPETGSPAQTALNGESDPLEHIPAWADVFDLAKFTSQCGRKGDALKMYLCWRYYGTKGFAHRVEAAFAAARNLATAFDMDDRIELLNGNPPACCQVCFRYIGKRVASVNANKEYNTQMTRGIVAALVQRGYMIDYTTGADGEYMRVVCNRNTDDQIVAHLVKAIIECGEEVANAV